MAEAQRLSGQRHGTGVDRGNQVGVSECAAFECGSRGDDPLDVALVLERPDEKQRLRRLRKVGHSCRKRGLEPLGQR
jgi:hypothetical protein